MTRPGDEMHARKFYIYRLLIGLDWTESTSRLQSTTHFSPDDKFCIDLCNNQPPPLPVATFQASEWCEVAMNTHNINNVTRGQGLFTKSTNQSINRTDNWVEVPVCTSTVWFINQLLSLTDHYSPLLKTGYPSIHLLNIHKLVNNGFILTDNQPLLVTLFQKRENRLWINGYWWINGQTARRK